MTQATYNVVPKDGGWLVCMSGDGVHEWHAEKDVAIRRARELGRPYDQWRVRVYNFAGALVRELTSEHASMS
jgi:hypothetical protein